jgi:hypothetical protein
MNGTDWAYDTLVDIALAHSKEHVTERAKQFRPDVLNACVGMACADIDWHCKKITKYAYETVRDVCLELTKETK